MRNYVWVCLCLIVPVSSGFGQVRPEQGATEVPIWTAGGHSVAGGRGHIGLWDLGLRYGWVLTSPVGPGILKGRFEYAIDAIPVYLVFQPANTAYGVGLAPLNLKWNFATRGRLAPYAELSGGVLFTTQDVPTGTSNVNFTPSVAFGTHFLGDKLTWSLEARYLHISNAGLDRRNPGINTFEVRLGVGKFKKSK